MAINTQLAALQQEVKDFKNEALTTMKRIETQTMMTNGKVAQTIRDIALLDQNQRTCPARVWYGNGSTLQTSREWLRWTPSLISVGVAVIALIISLK